MAWKCHLRNWLWLGLAMAMSSGAASAMPAPIARVGAASKTVMQKTYAGAKTVAKVPVRVVKYGVMGAKDVTVGVVNHVRNI